MEEGREAVGNRGNIFRFNCKLSVRLAEQQPQQQQQQLQPGKNAHGVAPKSRLQRVTNNDRAGQEGAEGNRE